MFTVEIPASWRESLADPCIITLRITRKNISTCDILRAVITKYTYLEKLIFNESAQLHDDVVISLKTGNGNSVGIVLSSDDLQNPIDERFISLVLAET